MVISVAVAGILPYASSYNAHTVNHAIATPVFQSAPLVAAAPAPLVAAAPAPLVAAAPAFIPRHAFAAGPAFIPSPAVGSPFAAPLFAAPSVLGSYPYVLWLNERCDKRMSQEHD